MGSKVGRPLGNPTGKGGFGDNPQNINRGGFTAEQRAKREANRNKAMQLEEIMFDQLLADVEDNHKKILEHIRPEVLKLIHTAIERVEGKAKQAVDLSSEDGSMSPGMSDAVLAALRAKHGTDT